MSLNSAKERVLKQYKTADNLKARIALHERFSTNRTWYSFVFDHLQAPQKARVLELGTGSGQLWRNQAARIPQDWDITLTDLSEGMLAEAKETLAGLEPNPTFETLDAQAIPFDDNTFDLVIANHMLYHVPDLDKAVSEIRRVLKPGGRLCAATNGAKHMIELDEFINNWLAEHDIRFTRSTSLSFLLENGAEILGKSFDTVERFEFPDNTLEVTEAAPLVDYILSMNRVHAGLESSQNPETLIEDLWVRARAKTAESPFIIHKSSGLFIASQKV